MMGVRILAVVALLLASMVPIGPASADQEEVNVDRPGADYRNFDVSGVTRHAAEDACRQVCMAEAQCRAWTFVKQDYSGLRGRCWLKNAIPAHVYSTCCTSGVPVRVGVIEANVDRPGRDIESFDLPAPDPNVCQAACLSNGRCHSWVYVRPGVQGTAARCWLKNAVPQAVTSGCCSSGVVPRGVGR